MNANHFTAVTTVAALLAAPGVARAYPVSGTYTDATTCDNHGNLIAVEEFGDASVFDDAETIGHVFTFTDQSACPATDDPNLINNVIEITNFTGRTLSDLYYVGDPRTNFSNVDGIADAGALANLDGQAFRIDAVGNNKPLIFESLVADGVLQPNEQWLFIVQDFSNTAGLAPDSFTSLGFADASYAIVETSAASIVQFVVPSPASVGFLALAGALAASRRRRIV